MRGKVAKFLRKKAEQLTRGWKGRRLVWVVPASKKKVPGARPVALMHVDCTRAMYLSFKKARKAKKA